MSEQYSWRHSNGCTRIEISEDCVAHWYDDETHQIVVGDYSDWEGVTQTLTHEQAAALRDDLDAALESLDAEAERRDD